MTQPDDNETTYVVWLDNTLLMLGSFILMAFMMLTLVNPVAPKTTEGDDRPGTLMVEIKWQDGIDSDVDLWVKAPGDKSIGYSNKAGKIFNLLRDDLGMVNDPLDLNYEVAYTRGLPPGDYTINVHLYRDPMGHTPIEVSVIATVQNQTKNSAKRILEKKVTLDRIGQEITVASFRIDQYMEIVSGSMNNIQRPLRSAVK